MKIENIKFKAKIGNVWEYGYPIKCADGWGFFVESRYEEGATLVDNKETICQYTGVNDKNGKEELINYAFRQILHVAELYNIDLFWHIEQKMKYNELRPRLNGNKY